MEVLPMTRTEAVKEFFKKAVLPVAIAGLLYCIFKSACMRNGDLDLLWLWILCGLPFGIHRMCVWIVPGGGSLGGGAALFVLNFVIGGIIGDFVLVWRLLVAAWYVPLTIMAARRREPKASWAVSMSCTPSYPISRSSWAKVSMSPYMWGFISSLRANTPPFFSTRRVSRNRVRLSAPVILW